MSHFKSVSAGKTGTGGFTLVELLVVLVLMGLLASMVFISVASGIFRSEEQRFLKQFAYELKRARTLAIGQGKAVRFLIDGADRLAGIQGKEMHPIPTALQIEAKGLMEDERGRAFLLFMPDGSSSGGEIDLVWNDGRREQFVIGMVFGTISINGEAG